MRLQSFSDKISSDVSYFIGLPINGVLKDFVMQNILQNATLVIDRPYVDYAKF